MTNLLAETLGDLRENGKREEDIKWVGGRDCYFTWGEFKKVANVEYVSGFGAPEVAQDLVIVGADWWLERYDYDGAEHWEFKVRPQKPERQIQLKALVVGQVEGASVGWEDVSELNRER